jgi:hypothetical protein
VGKKERIIHLISDLLGALETPMSLPGVLTKSVLDPFTALRHELHISGWSSSKVYETALEERLKDVE